jgi:hypothetical protein
MKIRILSLAPVTFSIVFSDLVVVAREEQLPRGRFSWFLEILQ